MNVRGGFEALRFGTCDDERDALGGRKLHFAAQVAHGIDHGLDRVHAGFGFSIKADFVKGGVGLHHDGGFLIFGAGACDDGDLLPEFLRDERNDRMSEAQNRFEHRHERVTRGAAGRFVALELDFGELKVPVAVLVPDEGVDGIGGNVETIVGIGLTNVTDGLFELAQDPAVDEGERHRFIRSGADAAVLTFDVHQHEAGGVPELRAEVAVAFGALEVEVDVAAERSIGGHREAEGVRAVGGDAFRIVLAKLLFNLRGLFGLAQAHRVLLHEVFKTDALDDVERVERVAFGLGHLLAFGIAHETVDVHVVERHAAREVLGHHDHASDPEEDDVVAGDEHGTRQVEVVGRAVVALRLRPAERGEGDEGGGEPSVEHVGVARELHAFACLLLSLFLATGDIDVAGFVVPGGNLMAPEKLAGEAPVLNVLEPLAVDAAPFLREDVDFTGFDGFQADFADGLARIEGAFGSGLAHGHVPLVGEHRLDDLARAGDARNHVAVFLDADEKACGLEVLDHGLAALVAVHAAVLFGHVVVHAGGLRQHVEHREVVTAADFKVVEVVGGRDLHAARAEFAVHVAVGDDGDRAAGERQDEFLADQRSVALVLWIDGDGLVAEKRFGTGRGNDDAFRAVGGRIADLPHVAVFLGAFDFKVGDGGLKLRVPVDEAVAAVDEAFLIKTNEGFNHDLGELFVHREVGAVPVDAVADAAHLVENRAARELLPFPDFFNELFARQGLVVNALLFKLALDDDLRGDAGMVRARNPDGVVAGHAVIARKRIHDRLIEGMPHVQNARDVGRRKLNGKARLLRVETGLEVAAFLPDRVPTRFDGGRIKALGELLSVRISHC